jgi:hypothetical protein
MGANMQYGCQKTQNLILIRIPLKSFKKTYEKKIINEKVAEKLVFLTFITVQNFSTYNFFMVIFSISDSNSASSVL